MSNLSNSESIADYALSLFPEGFTFPRKVMCGLDGSATGGQKTISNREDLIGFTEAADYVDCFIQTHSDWMKERGIFSLLFIDIDHPKDLNWARRMAFRTGKRIETMFESRPHIHFSGFKGYHILQPFAWAQMPKGRSELWHYILFLREYLSRGAYDHQLAGDIVRLFRMPGTFNSKGIRACGDGFVRVVQEWDGKRADSRYLYGSFKIWLAKRNITKPVSRHAFRQTVTSVRPEVQRLIDHAQQGMQLSHEERLAAVCELINNLSWSDEQIIQLFSKQDDFDPHRTAYYVGHARKQGYKPFKSQHLAEILGRKADRRAD